MLNMTRESFVVDFSKLFFEDFAQRFGRYSGGLVLYSDSECLLRVSQNTWNHPITSVMIRPSKADMIGDQIQVFVRNELGTIVSQIKAVPLGSSLGASRIAFAKDYGGKPLVFTIPGQEAIVFEGILHPGQVVSFWVRFEVVSNDSETLDDFQIAIVAECSA